MQIREQAHRIQCIRATYRPLTKKCEQKLVASFNKYHTEPPQEVIDLLTETEQKELADYMAARNAQKIADRYHSYINAGAISIATLAEAVENAQLTETQAAAIYTAMTELANALKKAGHAKPKRTRKPALRNNDKTGELFSDADAAGGVSDLTLSKT